MAFEERSDEPIITYEELLKTLKANDRILARHQEVGGQPPYLIRALDEILIYSSDHKMLGLFVCGLFSQGSHPPP